MLWHLLTVPEFEYRANCKVNGTLVTPVRNDSWGTDWIDLAYNWGYWLYHRRSTTTTNTSGAGGGSGGIGIRGATAGVTVHREDSTEHSASDDGRDSSFGDIYRDEYYSPPHSPTQLARRMTDSPLLTHRPNFNLTHADDSPSPSSRRPLLAGNQRGHHYDPPYEPEDENPDPAATQIDIQEQLRKSIQLYHYKGYLLIAISILMNIPWVVLLFNLQQSLE